MTDRTTTPPPPPGAPPPSGQPPSGPSAGTPPPGTYAAPPPATSGPRPWTAGRVISVIIGAIAALAAAGLLVAGFGMLVADQTMRDSDGYLTSPSFTASSSGFAVTSGDILLEGTNVNDGWLPESVIGDVRIRVTPQVPTDEVFVGLAPTGQVRAYLTGVGHTQVNGPGRNWTDVSGGAPPQPPGETDIWAVSTSGTGAQEVVWTPTTGLWSLVVMNPDATRGIDATVQVGATVPWLTGLAVGLIVGGVLAVALAIILIVIPVRLASRTRREASAAGPR